MQGILADTEFICDFFITSDVYKRQPLTLLDKDFLRENGVDIENNSDA